ncbi:acyltransferase family protein [Ruegeria sp. SCP11]|uniref:acyltransferase family protein n=1 Tax=Ruegeria sp. SCP11 TaxID=3141378 RepID=UPI00333C3220
MTQFEKRKLQGLQYLRAIAAIAVVIEHILGQISLRSGVAMPLDGIDLGARGVSLFFVLSGYIIYHAHSSDGRGWNYLYNFYYKRLIRIVPFTLLVASVWVVMAQLGKVVGVEASGGDFCSWLSASFILPLCEPYPQVIWTLRHEALFYLMFGVFFFSQRAFFVMLCLWAVGSILVPTGFPLDASSPEEILLVTAFSEANVLFLLGVLTGVADRKLLKFSVPSSVFLIGILISAGFGALLGEEKYTLLTVSTFGVFCAVLVFLGARVDMSWRMGELLGDASFAMYITHPLLLTASTILLFKITNNLFVVFMAEFLVMMLVAVLFYRFIEAPFLKLVRKKKRSAVKDLRLTS